MDPHVLSTIVLAGHWLIVVGLTIRVITRRSPVGVSIAWIAVMFSVPLVGAVLYLLFGEKRLGRRRVGRTAVNSRAMKAWQADLPQVDLRQAGNERSRADSRSLVHLAQAVLGFPLQGGNRIALLDDYDAIVDAMLADIDTARESCNLSFYIWDARGRTAEVVEELIRAAQRGVACRALGDALGSRTFLDGESASRLRDAGVQLLAALPTGPLPLLFARADLRNHRKILVIDNRVAYAGSQNLVDPQFFKQEALSGQWIDAMVRMVGPVAVSLNGVFELDWSVETRKAIRLPDAADATTVAPGGCAIQIAPSGPGLQPEAIHQLMLTAIFEAQREIVITTPYFVPDESIVIALTSAARRGVAVTLIVPARNDSLLVRYASVASFDDLLTAGVSVALFRGGLLHTKSLTIDRRTSIFGSVNLDMRSMYLNFEISLFVHDVDFTARLLVLQHGYLRDSEPVCLQEWRRRPRWRKFTEDTFRLLGPLL